MARTSSRGQAGSATPLRKGVAVLAVLLLTSPVLALWRLSGHIDGRLIACVTVILQVVTYVVYANDKRRAQHGHWRISEGALHLLEIAGGWPAAFIAQQRLRHKTSKRSFLIIFWLIVAAHQYLSIDYIQDWRMTQAIQSSVARALGTTELHR